MMRTALSLKPSNANAANENRNKNQESKTNFKNAPIAGKLTRQIGTSNLLKEMKPEHAPLIKFDSKENFEVFEDNVVPENDNNMIHELERKMVEKKEEEQRKKFLLTRDNSDVMSRCSEPPSEYSVAYEDDDCDKISVASSTFTTTVRASLSSFNIEGKSNVEEEYVKKVDLVIKKKAEKDAREEKMSTSEEYFDDIFKYMSHRQLKFRASHRLFSRQEQVNEEMRTILIDWFNDVVKEYRLQKETFHLAVSLVDRVLSHLNVDKVQFQLVGTTALMIAAKYEEIFPPEIEEFAIITDNTYRVAEILRMERFLLAKLKFVVATPTPVWFGSCFAKRLNFTPKMNKTLNYLLDLSMIDVDFLRYRPSDIAAAAIFFTNVQTGLEEAWPKKMIDETGIDTSDFVDVLRELHRMYISASSSDYRSIFNTYCDSDEKEVALIPAPTDRLIQLFPSIFAVIKSESTTTTTSPKSEEL